MTSAPAPAFDVIDTALETYKRIWAERAYILKLMALPLLIKSICALSVSFAGIESDFIRQSLVMIPSYFTEGWLMAQFIRTQLTGERWPYPVDLSSVANEVAIIRRVRGLLGSIIGYVLTMMAIALLMQSVMAGLNIPPFMQEEKITPEGQMVTMITMVACIALFRFVWLPIALVVNTRLSHYIAVTAGFLTSVRLFALWLLVTIPPGFVMLMIAAPFLGQGAATPPVIIIITMIQVVFSTLITLIAMSAVAQALKPVLKIS